MPNAEVKSRWRVVAMCAGLIALASGATGAYFWRIESLQAECRDLLKSRRYNEALAKARQVLAYSPRRSQALLVAGEASLKLRKVGDAEQYFAAVPSRSAADDLFASRLSLASLYLESGRTELADAAFREAAALRPDHHLVQTFGVHLMTITGRRWESLPMLLRLIHQPENRMKYLIYVGNLDEIPAPPEGLLERIVAVSDGLGLLGAGRVAAALAMPDRAVERLNASLERRPNEAETWVQLGGVYLDRSDRAGYVEWRKSMPKSAEDHPGIWAVYAREAHEAGRYDEAIRCFWETLKRHPNHQRASYQLGQLLAARGPRLQEIGKQLMRRSEDLAQLVALTVVFHRGRGNPKECYDCAQICQRLGRIHEARAWCEMCYEWDPSQTAALALRKRLDGVWRKEMPWVVAENNPALAVDLSGYPLPAEPTRAPSSSPVAPASSESAPVGLAFRDEAARLGVTFRYRNGDDPQTEGQRMFEYTGGGVGVIDYDLDGWPDLYLSQGSDWPPRREQREHLDHMYRNQQGRRFRESAALAGIVDGGFGQGVSAGDFDGDGFQDLYVANIDGNRLLRNCGDGTFEDVTAKSSIGHPYWTTSCLLADLNADGLPDLYDVTFLQGHDVFERICLGDDGSKRSCAPKGFEAAPDFVYLNNGDGTFHDVSKTCGIDVPDGDGLGIVVADFDRSGRLGVFIANDGRANFMFTPVENASPGDPWKVEEVGRLSGVAFDEDGVAQASMGVAADDFDGNGLVDLFVTNFFNESNTLYQNQGGNLFADRTRAANLREPSLLLLGFGTQFLDADLDGRPDLFLTNGHVDDFRSRDIPYKMRPQFFWNRGKRFQELKGDAVGEYFHRERLGRGVAVWDWNGDQRDDVVISHLDDTVAILTNRSERTARSVALRLVGAARSRDAIGTVVTLTGPDNYRRVRQQTAGDGYQASNQRQLIFGTGSVERIDRMEIEWPGGRRELFENVPTNCELVVVEGRGRWFELPRVEWDAENSRLGN